MDLTHHFLIAMPNMVDPHFAHTLTYVCEHTDQGALGLVVNRPTDMSLATLFAQVDVALDRPDIAVQAVHFGGPVQPEHGFVLHRPRGDWSSTLVVGEDLGLTTSRDILQALAGGFGPEQFLISLGYAGWGPGQLEQELAQNAWLTVRADLDLVFDLPPEDRVGAAMGLLGIDPSRLSDEIGHA